MEFTDFKPEELIGKTVVHQSGASYSGTSKTICHINKVTKTGFRIDAKNCEDYLFDFTGHRKGLTGRQNMGQISHCELISDEQAIILRAKWAKNKEASKIRTFICDNVHKLTFEQLSAIKDIMEVK